MLSTDDATTTRRRPTPRPPRPAGWNGSEVPGRDAAAVASFLYQEFSRRVRPFLTADAELVATSAVQRVSAWRETEQRRQSARPTAVLANRRRRPYQESSRPAPPVHHGRCRHRSRLLRVRASSPDGDGRDDDAAWHTIL